MAFRACDNTTLVANALAFRVSTVFQPSLSDLTMGFRDNEENNKPDDLYGDENGGEEEEDEDEDEDDFLPHRRKYSDDEDANENADEEKIPAKRQRYSPSVENGSSMSAPPLSAKVQNTSSVSRPLAFAGSRPALEHSIINVEPLDELIKDVADFVHHLIANRRECVEIEARIGVLRDPKGQRIRLPVSTETSTRFVFQNKPSC